MPIGLTNVSARNSRNTPTFSNHRSINSPGEIKSSLLSVGGDTHQKNDKKMIRRIHFPGGPGPTMELWVRYPLLLLKHLNTDVCVP